MLAFQDIYDEHYEKREFYRNTFVENIMNAGLQVELEDKLVSRAVYFSKFIILISSRYFALFRLPLIAKRTF